LFGIDERTGWRFLLFHATEGRKSGGRCPAESAPTLFPGHFFTFMHTRCQTAGELKLRGQGSKACSRETLAAGTSVTSSSGCDLCLLGMTLFLACGLRSASLRARTVSICIHSPSDATTRLHVR
jgi:hypothetical protein